MIIDLPSTKVTDNAVAMGAVWALQPKLNPLLLIGVAMGTKKHREIASQCFMNNLLPKL